MTYYISPVDCFELLMGPNPPLLIDVRRPNIIEQSGFLFPAMSILADQEDGLKLAATLDPARPIVVACAHAHNRSQLLASALQGQGFKVRVIEHGADGWLSAKLPVVKRQSIGLESVITLGAGPTIWVTRRKPKIDRVACPWLIQRFLDPNARFVFAEPEWVLEIAKQTGAIPYDLPGAPLEHDGPLCTFDTILRAFGLNGDPALAELALIIRGADTDRLDLHPAAAGLLATALGLSQRNGDDDHATLREGFLVYDGLYAWARHARGEKHNWPRPAASGKGAAA
jgi:rhodanese-related sulfurtransferase